MLTHLLAFKAKRVWVLFLFIQLDERTRNRSTLGSKQLGKKENSTEFRPGQENLNDMWLTTKITQILKCSGIIPHNAIQAHGMNIKYQQNIQQDYYIFPFSSLLGLSQYNKSILLLIKRVLAAALSCKSMWFNLELTQTTSDYCSAGKCGGSKVEHW